MAQYIRSFNELSIEDVPLVGGKNASLGEMYRELAGKGVKVPNGFAITAEAYRYLLKEAGIEAGIKTVLQGLNTHDVEDLAQRGEKVRQLILNSQLPEALSKEIMEGYKTLCKEYGDNADVAVRSSATAEDLPDASFAGQQETFLNIRGESALLDACRRCFASLFTNRAISYREDKGFDHFQVALSIGIQKMIRSDQAASGVIFSIDTETGFKDVVFVTSSYGLGENIVQGVVNPDEFYVFKPTLQSGFRPILQKAVGSKEIKMIYDTRGGTKQTRNIPVAFSDRSRFSITDDEVLQLSKWAVIIEDHYTQKAGHFKPMDIEWAKDGVTGELFILQARPETVQAMKDRSVLETYRLVEKGPLLATGRSVGAKIGQGKAHIIRDVKEISRFKKGEILVTEMTDPDWEPIMKIAAGIITERGGRTCHAAIVSRELGIPAIVGADHAMGKIKEGEDITLSCAEGEEGRVYQGLLKFEVDKVSLTNLARPKTKVMMNVGEPDQVFDFSFIPNDGVGLARMEFIINNAIKIHPMALIRYPKLKDEKAKARIEELTTGYQNKSDYFVEKLAEGFPRLPPLFIPRT